MKDVALCILTRGRGDRQTTLENIPDVLRDFVYLVVDKDEYVAHKKYSKSVKKILQMPVGWGNSGGFSDKKQWTSERIKERYYFIIDDDLSFNKRTGDKLMKTNSRDVYKAFDIMYGWMKDEDIAHVALSPREGNNRVIEEYRDASRAMRVCGFDMDIIRKEKVMFNRTVLMADFDITLSLLEKGYSNRVLYSYANGQRKSNDSGGCSFYRTPELMSKTAHKLHSLHPLYVKVETKKTAQPWCGFDTRERTDVTVSWRKAFEFGKAKTKKGGISTFFGS